MDVLEYGLLGRSLGHSFSPEIHRRLGSYDYRLVELAPQEVGPFLEAGSFRGLNVTIPYKKTVMAYCQELSPAAQRIGSVNTLIRREDGSLFGDNTDYDGFCYMLRKSGLQAAGKKALVLGSGGASLTVCTVLRDMGAREVVTISRSGPDNYENLERHRDAQLLINTTPVGTYPNTGAAPVSLDAFPLCEGVLDLIYNPAKTQLLLDAERRGLTWANGLGMLVAQAKAAAERFLGQKIPDTRVAEIACEVERETKNIVLIGMPGCGKSTIGAALAQALGRTLADVDSAVEEDSGRRIPQIFAEEGEEGFRRWEHQAICRLGRESRLVIATGGGAPTRRENWDPLRQNSTVVYLRRELELLPTQGRPISQRVSAEELYRQRAPLYEELADITVDNRGSVEETVQAILRGLGR